MSKIVNLPGYGVVRSGKVTKANHPNARSVHQFVDIPFAKPPVGKLRFCLPERALPWDGILCNEEQQKIPLQMLDFANDHYFDFSPQKRTFYRKHCSEDCLYLNVFVPDARRNKMLPVMVWFYGGAFQRGPPVFFDATALSGMNDVIVVVPNYRVNTLGFMTMGEDGPCKGNLGLFDQLQALKWVQECIEYFDGDRDNVTLFGHSAGGISVNMHMLSPLSKGYFHKAISFSGTATMARICIKDQRRPFKKLLEILNINESKPERILEKLQAVSTEEIYNANVELLRAKYTWFPTLDGSFLPDEPLKLMSNGQISKMPYLLGCTNSEGGWLMNAEIPSYVQGAGKEDAMYICSSFLKHFNRSIDAKKALPLLEKIYNDKSPSDDEQFYTKMLSGIMADTYFINGIAQVCQIHAAWGRPTYFYEMTHAPRYNHEDEYGPKKARKPSHVACDHGDDVIIFWGTPFLPDRLADGFRYSADEERLSRRAMTYITNFAKTGNPNVGAKVELEWPAYTTREKRHLVLDSRLEVESHFGMEALFLYGKVLPKL